MSSGRCLKGGVGAETETSATLSREECEALMSAYDKGKFAFRNNLIIRTLYATGLRAEELENVKFCDIFYDNKTVFVRAGKGDKDRYCAIDKTTLELLKKWQEGKELSRVCVWDNVKANQEGC